MPKKVARCPRGYNRHRKTRKCVSKTDGSVLPDPPDEIEKTIVPSKPPAWTKSKTKTKTKTKDKDKDKDKETEEMPTGL